MYVFGMHKRRHFVINRKPNVNFVPCRFGYQFILFLFIYICCLPNKLYILLYMYVCMLW